MHEVHTYGRFLSIFRRLLHRILHPTILPTSLPRSTERVQHRQCPRDPNPLLHLRLPWGHHQRQLSPIRPHDKDARPTLQLPPRDPLRRPLLLSLDCRLLVLVVDVGDELSLR